MDLTQVGVAWGMVLKPSMRCAPLSRRIFMIMLRKFMSLSTI